MSDRFLYRSINFSDANYFYALYCSLNNFVKPGGLDLSRRDLDRDLDLDAKKVSVSTVKKISTVSKS